MSSASVFSNTCSCEPALGSSTGRGSPSGRRASTNGWYGSSAPTRVDRAPEQDLEPGGAGTSRELGREPGLADARFAGDEDGRAASGSRRIEGALELPELAYASDEDLARASHHFGQYRALPPAARQGGVRTRPTEDTHAGGRR